APPAPRRTARPGSWPAGNARRPTPGSPPARPPGSGTAGRSAGCPRPGRAGSSPSAPGPRPAGSPCSSPGRAGRPARLGDAARRDQLDQRPRLGTGHLGQAGQGGAGTIAAVAAAVRLGRGGTVSGRRNHHPQQLGKKPLEFGVVRRVAHNNSCTAQPRGWYSRDVTVAPYNSRGQDRGTAPLATGPAT